jgi:TolB-like protein/Tfp pilus assembly protein PilF
VTEPSHALFLSYASEDAAASERIATALRAAGIEVWFDKSELRGGDAWDRRIRRQIRECSLFVPVISAHSQARPEGYFRLEWDLADQRTHLMGRNRAFVVPVCPDSTPERVADVPDSFLAVQWTRLPGGETPPAFVARVQHLLSGEASTLNRASVPAREHPPAGVIAVALLLVVGFFGLERLRGSKPSVQSGSIAVLPLTNESGDANEQYFSDGISEDLITALGQFPGLKVIGRTSSFQFRDSKEDSRTIGAKLGVAHLLEGSVRRAGDMVRVSAELIDTGDGTMQWSEHYDRHYSDLFALQDAITRAVAGALRAKLLPGRHAAAQGEQPPSGSLEAYNALLQGQFYASRDTEADLRKAIEFYTHATELDPRYALALSRLSQAWTQLGGGYLDVAPAGEAYAKARAAADRALALSPELAEAHLARGSLLQYADLDWRGAEEEFRRAMVLAPNDGGARFQLGIQLATFGEVEQAIELTREALATEPLRANWYGWLSAYLSGVNRLDEAEKAIRSAIELQPGAAPNYEQLAIVEIQRGNAQEALAAAQQGPPGNWQDIALALARQLGGDRPAADAALRTLIDKDAGVAAYQIAEVYALRGDANETFAWLDQALSNHDSGITNLLYDPFIARYKNDPRFAAFCRKVGLPVPGETPASKSSAAADVRFARSECQFPGCVTDRFGHIAGRRVLPEEARLGDL